MKTLYTVCSYLFVFIFFVIPPLFNKQITDPAIASSWSFPFFIIPMGILSLFLWFEQRDHTQNVRTSQSTIRHIILSSYTLKTFGALCIVSSIMQIIASYLKHSETTPNIIPHTPLQTVITLCTFTITAFYEEMIYRQFLPNMYQIIKSKVSLPKPLIFTVQEIMPLMLFAFAHRYLGTLAIINAACCGIILRICTLKTGTIIPGYIAHVCYNIFTLCLYLVLRQ
ncbi:MAG: CPBP family intramembrane metalloprotease [Treponema sp.]|nr:CPBP family intramembrane metalloprotease [Treponema sp.]